MKHKTSELSGALLDAAVAKAEGWQLIGHKDHSKPFHRPSKDYPGSEINDWEQKGPHPRWVSPDGSQVVYLCSCRHEKGEDALPAFSTDGRIGQAIIERERIKLDPVDAGGMLIGVRQDRDGWLARCPEAFTMERGDTALIAACRAFVAHKLGDEVEL